jgi:hypothetical protein
MAKTCEVEIFVVVDAAGDYGVGTDAENARTHYEDSVGDLTNSDGFRTLKLTVTIPLPEIMTLTGEADDDGPPATLNKVENA